MSLQKLSRSDWDDLIKYVRSHYNKSYANTLSMDIQAIGSKYRLYRRAATFGPYGRTLDHLKRVFEIPFNDLPKRMECPKDLQRDLWEVLILFRLDKGI